MCLSIPASRVKQGRKEMDNEIIKKKLEYFFEQMLPVHLQFKSGRFANGNIKKINDDSLILEELKLGIMMIFFEEISPTGISQWKEKEVGLI